MILVTRSGEAVEVNATRPRLTNEQLARMRAMTMKKMREAGSPAEEVAAFFRVTPRHVRREIRSLESRNASVGSPA